MVEFSFSFLTFFDPFTLVSMNGYFLLHIAHYTTFPTGLYSFHPRSMVRTNISFKLVSLNVPRIRSFEKRKAVYNWLHKSRAEICFYKRPTVLQKQLTYGKKQWKGNTFFPHGSCHSKGTMILVKDHLDFKLISSKIDLLGRYIFLEVEIQDSLFLLLNIYAPNKCAEQCDFLANYRKNLKILPQMSDVRSPLSLEGILTSFLIQT